MSTPGEGFLGEREEGGGRAQFGVLTAAAAVFGLVFVISLFLYAWPPALGLATFMAVLTGVLGSSNGS